MEVCPPGGAKTREVGRPVRTFGPFALLPEAKALLDTMWFALPASSVGDLLLLEDASSVFSSLAGSFTSHAISFSVRFSSASDRLGVSSSFERSISSLSQRASSEGTSITAKANSRT